MGKTPEKITFDNVKEVLGEASAKRFSREEIEFPYKCEICDKRFKTAQGKVFHMRTHKIETIDLTSEEKEIEEDPTEWVSRYARRPIANQEVIDILSQQEKVTFLIPENMLETRLTYVVGINGQLFDYPVGQYVVLPRDIVTLIKNIYKETETAKRRNLVERSKEVQEALS